MSRPVQRKPPASAPNEYPKYRNRFGPQRCDCFIARRPPADPAPSPMHALIDEERLHAATELISALPAESRETLLLFYREGQSSQQVALLLGLSDAAVRK